MTPRCAAALDSLLNVDYLVSTTMRIRKLIFCHSLKMSIFWCMTYFNVVTQS